VSTGLLVTAIFVVFGAALTAQPAEARSEPVADACGASRLQRFVGQPVERLQRLRPPGRKARYACRPGCAMTMDFSPDRLTVVYDTRSRRILELRCV
jgi:hypothetical protein